MTRRTKNSEAAENAADVVAEVAETPEPAWSRPLAEVRPLWDAPQAETAAPVPSGAEVMNGSQIAAKLVELAAEWPEGTRVSEKVPSGTRTGTVHLFGNGVVTHIGHPNYGRTFVGVVWDFNPELAYNVNRSRPFTDNLIKLNQG